MDNQLILSLKSEMAKRNITTPKLAMELGIKQDRIYKWLSGANNPKATDAELIKNWISGNKSSTIGETLEYYDIGTAIRRMEAVTSAILAVSAEILAKVSDRSAAAVRAEVEMMVKNILNSSEQGQSNGQL